MIFYNKHFINNTDIQEVLNTLRFGKLSKGKKLSEFENRLKTFFKSKYCVVLSNGTAAQILLSKALGWKKNDNIILSPLTFVSGANSIALSGANPIFVDIKKEDQNLDPNLVEKKILEYRKTKKKIKAIMVTDYGGLPADWKQFKEISQKYNIHLINDNCHALGSKYKKDRSYQLKYADYLIQSFHAVKNITTGEGGALITNDKIVFKKIRDLREHGFKSFHQINSPWDYDIEKPGYNFRLSEMNCALGCSQIKRINSIITKRRKISKLYDNFFKNYEYIKTVKIYKNKLNSYHLYPIIINFKKLKKNQTKFFKILKKKYKIQLQKHYIPSYRFSYFRKKYKSKFSNFKNTEEFYKNSFSLPLYLGLTKKDVQYICKSILKTIQLS